MSNQFMFADETSQQTTKLPTEYWKILIVDDEPEVHAVTKLALNDFNFLGRGLKFYSAFSGEEAKRLIDEHPDAAIFGKKPTTTLLVLFCGQGSRVRHLNARLSLTTTSTTTNPKPNSLHRNSLLQ